MAEQQDPHIQVARIGLNLEQQETQLSPGTITFCLNGNIFNFDGNSLSYQNDNGNVICETFPTGFKIIGVKNITTSLNRCIFFLVNPNTNDSQIGYIEGETCIYKIIIDDTNSVEKLNFNINYPIHKVIPKTTNCSTEIYWTDGLNPRRFLDFDSLPWKEISGVPIPGQLDSNKLLVQPNFSIPEIEVLGTQIGGKLVTGTYQFAVQYTDAFGDGYSSFYNVTNPLGIDSDAITPNFDTVTSKAINLQITNLDTSGLYDYFNIAVIQTINNVPTVKNLGTFPISGSTYNYIFTGIETSTVQLSIADIFEKYPYYDTAQDVFEVDNVLGWSNLTKSEDINYQQIWSNVKLQWVTYRIPYNTFEAYNNPENTSKFRGYMRDEVYAFEGCFILKNGMQTKSFHIPGRASNINDLDIIPISNKDVFGNDTNPCDRKEPLPRWKVYNTGNLLGRLTSSTDDCYIGEWEYGEFAYWESSDSYDGNTNIWGSLANTPIRHHKFPDSLITHIHDQNVSGDPSFVHSIYPIGVRIDPQSLYTAIANSSLTSEQKNQIAGFKILRGNRVNNKTVISKGLSNNVGKYDYIPVDSNYIPQPAAKETYYFANWPYNDLRPDPYFTDLPLNPKSGSVPPASLNEFTEADSERFVFHSPDTHFYQPSISDGLQFKIETIEYGNSFGKFIQVYENAKYLFLNKYGYNLAYAAGLSSIFNLGVEVALSFFPPSLGANGTFGFNPENALPAYQSIVDILTKILPYTNFGYFYASYGLYNKYFQVPNSGNKTRYIDKAQYLIDGYQSIESGNVINNFQRESSVYIKTSESLPYAHNYDGSIPLDNSRFTIASYGGASKVPELERKANITSYYASLKINLLNPYGRIYSYETIDTGFYSPLYNNGTELNQFKDVFGGDVFINRFAHKQKLPIFDDNTVGDPDQTDIYFDQIANFTYPMFWLSTKSRETVDLGKLVNAIGCDFLDSDFNTLDVLVLILTGPFKALRLMVFVLREMLAKLGANSNINLDNAINQPDINCSNSDSIKGSLYEQGIMYLFSYGIPYYFVESEVNVDYRQAYNNLEGDFYPRVGNNIPDEWLQESNVSIAFDNTYTYNETFSKQNKENAFTHLRPDYDPNNLCYTNYPNRAIWSNQSSLEETKNNWLVYKPLAYFDFTKSYGDLISLDKLENRAVLARFENKSQIYNAMTTIQPTDGIQAYLGNPALFSGTPPIDLSETDTGSFGTQNKFLLRTEAGHVFVDAKRGQIVLLQGTERTDLSEKGMDKWFSHNLPFNILEVSPEVPIDNAYNSIGITGTYDNLYKRLFITKIDYQAKPGVKYSNFKFYIETPGDSLVPTEVFLDDPTYFINKSFTVSYSFITNSWVSFHSFIPNYYVAHENYFQTGINGAVCSIWNHNTNFSLFNNYYNTDCSYILEYPFAYQFEDEILQNVKDYTKARKYRTFTEWYSPDETIYFNKCILYNEQQCSGLLNFVPRNTKDLSQYRKYPKNNVNSIDILLNKSDSFYQFNSFWDISKSKNSPIFIDSEDLREQEKTLNQSNMDYSVSSYKSYPLRAKYSKIRMILDNRTDVKLISEFVVNQSIPSKK